MRWRLSSRSAFACSRKRCARMRARATSECNSARSPRPIARSRSGAIRSSIHSTGPTRTWCCAPTMQRSSRRPNVRSRRCWSECGEHNQRAPEPRPLTGRTGVRAPLQRPGRLLVSTTQFASGGSRIDALLEQVYGLGPISMEVVMAVSRAVEMSAFQVASRRIALIAASAVFFATVQAQAQQAQTVPEGRVIVTGEGDVAVAPDHVQLTSGVTTRAKSVKEATDTNSKVMAAVTAALLESGIEQKDIQTLRFSIQPVYAPQGPRTEP